GGAAEWPVHHCAGGHLHPGPQARGCRGALRRRAVPPEGAACARQADVPLLTRGTKDQGPKAKCDTMPWALVSCLWSLSSRPLAPIRLDLTQEARGLELLPAVAAHRPGEVPPPAGARQR